jgi:type I site-specific restriction-modification system R (restriction) subunit
MRLLLAHGTPIEKTTTQQRVFGNYIDIYDMTHPWKSATVPVITESFCKIDWTRRPLKLLEYDMINGEEVLTNRHQLQE